jgi:hypothetical protein
LQKKPAQTKRKQSSDYYWGVFRSTPTYPTIILTLTGACAAQKSCELRIIYGSVCAVLGFQAGRFVASFLLLHLFALADKRCLFASQTVHNIHQHIRSPKNNNTTKEDQKPKTFTTGFHRKPLNASEVREKVQTNLSPAGSNAPGSPSQAGSKPGDNTLQEFTC